MTVPMRRASSSRTWLGWLLLVLAVATFLRVWGMAYGLPLPKGRPDEDTVVKQAFQMLASGDPEPPLFDYPSLPLYLDTLAMAVYYQFGSWLDKYDELFDFQLDAVVLRPGLHYSISRVVSIGFGVATVAATFGLAFASYGNRGIGLLSSLCLATALLHVIYSRFATVDIIMTFFVTSTLVFAVKAAQNHRTRHYLLAGFFAGLAASSKYNAGLVVLSFCIPAFGALIRSSGWSERGRIVGKVALGGLAAAGAFALTSPYALVHHDLALRTLRRMTRMLYAPPDQRAIWVHLKMTLPWGMGWFAYVAALIGMMRAAWLRRPADQALLGFLLPFFFLIGSVTVVYPRYVLPLLPILFVFAAEAVYSVLPRRPVLVALTVAALAGPGLVSSIHFDRVAARKDTRLLASEWIAKNLPKRVAIAVCRGWGAPNINSDRRRPPAFEPVATECRPGPVRDTGARFVVTHEHPYLRRHSSVPDEMKAFLRQRGRPLAEFDPFRKGVGVEPYFYRRDAFYLPLAGLRAMERGGPIVTIWELSAPR